MLLLTKGQTSEFIYVTLNEKRTLADGWYLFVFTNIATREVVNKIFSFSEDQSDYPDRYNKFEINTSAMLDDSALGQYTYVAYEQEDGVNTDPTGLTEVERGLMKLKPSTEFAFAEYSEDTSYKQYEG